MTRVVVATIAGLIFGLGIIISGMSNPEKVLAFFDITGDFDPSLAFVMAGAVVVTSIGYRLAFRSKAPLFDTRFHLPTATAIDLRLIGGSAIFGIGWGLAGFCPGGAVPALGVGFDANNVKPAIFLLAMVIGMAITRLVLAALAPRGRTTA